MELCGDIVDLRFVFCRELEDEHLLNRYRDLLTDQERYREFRLRSARARKCYVVTRALARTTLADYTSIRPRELVFGKNEYGRPYIANKEWQDQLDFNISHTQDVVMLGVTASSGLGVDIESRHRRVPLEIADQYFSIDETRRLRSLPEPAQADRFLEYWTLKESYIKARGAGLSIPLDEFSFMFIDSPSAGITFHSRLDESPGEWLFWQFRPDGDHIAAVCLRRRDRGAGTLRLKQTVPLDSEVSLEPKELKVSF